MTSSEIRAVDVMDLRSQGQLQLEDAQRKASVNPSEGLALQPVCDYNGRYVC